jgi:hypothetical protein
MSSIPNKEADFIDWNETVIKVSKEHTVELYPSADNLAEFETLRIEVKSLHEKCRITSCANSGMQEKNEKRDSLNKEESGIRTAPPSEQWQNDLSASRSTTRPIRAAPSRRSISKRPTRIEVRPEKGSHWGKSEFVHGFECLWVITDAPPEKRADLLHAAFATQSPLELEFEENERGKRAHFAVRLESGTVKKGHWSDIFNAVIP